MAFIKYVTPLFIFSSAILNGLKAETPQKENTGIQLAHFAKEKFINFIAKQKGYDTNGWVNILTADHDINNLSFQIDKNGDLICNNDNQAVEILITDEKILKQTTDAIFSELSILPRSGTNSGSITKIPIKRPKNGSNNFFSNQNAKNNLPVNSEAYLVCAKKNSNVVLVPKHADKVEFIPGPWIVRASVNIYKDPLKPFGRAFRITVVDGVNVLANKQNSFTWFMPLKSFSEVYHFHMAAKDSKNGTYCNLERSVDNKVIKLHCPSWGTHYKLIHLNMILASMKLGMTLMHNATLPYINKIYADNTDLKLHQFLSKGLNKNSNLSDNEDIKDISNSDDDSTDNISGLELSSVDDLHNDISDSINKTDIMHRALNAIFFSILAISNTIYVAKEVYKLVKKLKDIDIEFENARPFYEWTITHTESNYQPDMALEKKKKIFFPESNSLNNPVFRKDETIKKFQDIKNNNHKPTNEKKLEHIIMTN
ncbi:hypothetical protein YYG_00445 [Plasmodium vinckei petteri]|uniref:Parasitophorous vacuolar protein 2 n=1 Tax=Plasmodium vinckei petteri TaxID=138298 RepID=W7B0M5_PLAVN|nr:hypothetical protein YYG_00445 [Plasmodium vinckei petteri]CAD2114049.1 conserved Plasmodium protein, unknown function [Plasmodium vinckei petteri]